MKRAFTITCLLLAFTSFAQRNADLKVKLINPVNNQYVPAAIPFSLKVNIINQGADTLRMSDSIQLIITWDGTPVVFANGNQMQPYMLKQGYTIAPGDSALLSMAMAFNNTPAATSSFCVKAKPYNTNDLIADPDTSDNEQCITLVHDMTDVQSISTTMVTVYPVPAHNQLFISGYKSDGNTTLRVIDISGKTMLSQAIPPHEEKTSIDISKLAPGQYFYQLIENAGTINGKFIKE